MSASTSTRTARTGTDITTTPCFLAGTQILTERGEVPVERLAAGDTVVTLSGRRRRRSSGSAQGRVLATRGRRNAATPVIVRKGALATTCRTATCG